MLESLDTFDRPGQVATVLVQAVPPETTFLNGDDYGLAVGLRIPTTGASSISSLIQAGSRAGISIAFSGKAGTVGIRAVVFFYFFFPLRLTVRGTRSNAPWPGKRNRAEQNHFPRVLFSLTRNFSFQRHGRGFLDDTPFATRWFPISRTRFKINVILCLGLVFFP